MGLTTAPPFAGEGGASAHLGVGDGPDGLFSSFALSCSSVSQG